MVQAGEKPALPPLDPPRQCELAGGTVRRPLAALPGHSFQVQHDIVREQTGGLLTFAAVASQPGRNYQSRHSLEAISGLSSAPPQVDLEPKVPVSATCTTWKNADPADIREKWSDDRFGRITSIEYVECPQCQGL